MKSNLRHLVHSNFKNNPALCYLPSSAVILLDEEIPFKLLMLHSLQNKPPGIKVDDPFLPPFEEGIFITDLSDSHSLVFNKFCVCDHHVIAFPKAFEHQTSPLTVADFSAAALVIAELQAFMFFNCGPDSGMSVPHKHMQLIPYESLGGKLPIEEAYFARKAYWKDKSDPLLTIPQLQGIRLRFKELEDYREPQQLHRCYHELLKDLEISSSESYNLILTPRLMWVVVREKNSVISTEDPLAKVDINSLGFVGTIAVKN